MTKPLAHSPSQVPRRFLVSKLGRKIGAYGPQAQVLAFYLLSSPYLDTRGQYDLPLDALQAHTQIGLETLKVLLSQLENLNFCSYDWPAERVHVPLVTEIYSKLFNKTTGSPTQTLNVEENTHGSL